MANHPIPNARTFWEAKDYLSATRVGLTTIVPPKYKTPEHFTDVFLNLTYALYGASQANLFNEFKKIFAKYMAIVAPNDHIEPPNGYHNHATLMQHNLCATIFQYYEGICSIDEIRAAAALLVKFSSRAADPSVFKEYNAKLLRMAHLVLSGEHAYFIVRFKLPFALPVPDGKYEVACPDGKTTIEVAGFTANDVSSRVDDRHFSKVEVAIKGFTCTDNYWNGPDIDNDSWEPRNSGLALSIVNRIVLEAKLTDEALRIVMASQRDIGNVVTTQYDGEGTVFHLSIGLTFGGFALVDTLSRQQITEEQCQFLTERLSVEAMSMDENLYAQALIQRSAENAVGAYYLLNSATEAMIDRFLFSLCQGIAASHELERFLLGESICTTCEQFKASPTPVAPPRSANPPSPFQRLKFLQEVGLAKSSEVRRLQKLLATVRKDDLRNDLSHGRRNSIPSVALDNAIAGFRDLRAAFQALAQAR